MKNVILTIALLLLFISSKAQQVKIGDNAENVKGQVEWLIRDYNRIGSAKQMEMWHKVLWNNGRISEVIIERRNVPSVSPDGALQNQSFKTRYIMSNGKCSRILIEYYNLSLADLKKQSSKRYHRIDNYYFEDGYDAYVTLFLGKSGLATKEIHDVPFEKLPESIRRKIEIESNE